MSGKKLSVRENLTITRMYADGDKVQYIAHVTGRSSSTISRHAKLKGLTRGRGRGFQLKRVACAASNKPTAP